MQRPAWRWYSGMCWMCCGAVIRSSVAQMVL
nr:MAG TPA: outer capsid protein sigma-1 attachment protein [Caudoviricetes sp.]